MRTESNAATQSTSGIDHCPYQDRQRPWYSPGRRSCAARACRTHSAFTTTDSALLVELSGCGSVGESCSRPRLAWDALIWWRAWFHRTVGGRHNEFPDAFPGAFPWNPQSALPTLTELATPSSTPTSASRGERPFRMRVPAQPGRSPLAAHWSRRSAIDITGWHRARHRQGCPRASARRLHRP